MGIKDFVPHVLRRTYATKLLEMNVNPRVVADLMGHTKLDMVMRYMQVPNKSQQEAIETLNNTYKVVIGNAILEAQCNSEEFRASKERL